MVVKFLKPHFDNRRREIPILINGKSIYFTITPIGICITHLDIGWVDDPDFPEAAKEAMAIQESMFYPEIDKWGAHEEWRTENVPFTHALKFDMLYDRQKDEYINKPGYMTLVITQDSWVYTDECKYIQYVELPIVEKMRNEMTETLRQEFRQWERELEQREKVLEQQRRELEEERRQMEAERRVLHNLVKYPDSAPDLGYVYLLHNGHGQWKIGKSAVPANRLSQYKTSIPNLDKFEVLIPCGNMTALEASLHQQFSAKRIKNEWFSLSDDDVAYIRSLA